MNKSIPSVCCIGGGAPQGGSGGPPPVQATPQGQAIPGLTMPTLQDIMAGGGGPAQGMVNSPMPQSHGAANQSIIAAILKML